MVLNLSVPELKELKPKITVIGVGGAGNNAIDNMINSGLAGVDFVAANTDAQALSKCLSDCKVQLGAQITKGLGAGSHPDIGKAAADETKHEIMEHLDGTNMLFITAGMGGGTGTGAAPVIARVAKELGILTVAVVTTPFQFEGAGRMRIAQQGLKELEGLVDTTIVVPNQNLMKVTDEKTTFLTAFAMADEVLHAGVRSITDLMVVPGLINLDFADVRTIMNSMGRAMMGTGEAEGENRAIDCAAAAIANPLLDDYSLDGAKGLLINITGGSDLTLFEVDKVTNAIRAEVHPEADVIVGSIFDEKMEGKIRVSVVATGLGPQTTPGRRIVDLHVTNSTNSPVNSSNDSPSISSMSMQAEAEAARLAAEAERIEIEIEEARLATEARLENVEMPLVTEEEIESEISDDLEENQSENLVDDIGVDLIDTNDSGDSNDYTSIMDLISDGKADDATGNDVNSDAPDLFSTTSETLSKNENDTDSVKDSANEIEEDYLEIPAFLRRQSR